MKIEEINKLPISERITELKKRPTELPNKEALLNDWDSDRHEVMNPQIREKRKVVKKDPIKDALGNIVTPAEYEFKDVNRIAIPLEQDIVNIQTAFTVGTEPDMTCETDDQKEKDLFEIIKKIIRRNKIKYLNKRVMRSWLSEQEVAEYWYTVADDSWWRKILQKLVSKLFPKRKLRVSLWSPFRGDELYPYFDEYGDMIAFSRKYRVKENEVEVERFMTIDDKNVTIYQSDEQKDQFAHGFPKLPVIYIYRDKPYCHKIKTIRARLETLLSNFADCLDFNFFPKITANGVIEDIKNRGTVDEVIQLENGAEVAYLTWQQSPDMAKLEFENLTERAYSLTNTPRVSLEYLKGLGNTVSGASFRYTFMGAHMQVSNHAEDMEEYLQRRVNFLVSAVGVLYPTYKETSETIDIEVEIVPFMIDNRSDNISDAVAAVEGGIASRKQGIILAGLTDAIEDELAEIESDKKKVNEGHNEGILEVNTKQSASKK